MKLYTFMLHHSSDFFDPDAEAQRTARSSMGMLKSIYKDCFNQKEGYSMLVAIASVYDTETKEHEMEIVGEYYAPLKKQVELNKRAKAQKTVIRKSPFKAILEPQHMEQLHVNPGDWDEIPMPAAEGEF